jgi:8-oxo-dGTP pyrophosphatase MutT (NUDIX family)
MPGKRRRSGGKKQVSIAQCAALPVAVRDGETMAMLVTSRTGRRWVLPKGGIEDGMEPHETAARRAFEAAGLVGTAERAPIGFFSCGKQASGGRSARKAGVFLMHVDRQESDWPERGQRETCWFSLAGAAMAADDGELVALLLRMAAPAA